METVESDAELQLFSDGVRGRPRDLLRHLSGDFGPREPPQAAPGGEIKISLGLSLGGCFGVDQSPRNSLGRSSSINFLPFLQMGAREPGDGTLLKRTCSLPAEAKGGEGKRKELQCMRRMEAKRRRAENLNGFRLGGEDEGDCRRRGDSKFERLCDDRPMGPTLFSGTADRTVGATVRIASASQGSAGSLGSSSSGLSDFDNGTDSRGGASAKQPLPNSSHQKVAPEDEDEGMPPEDGGAAVGCEETRGMMEDMPCVSTTGNGPNGRRIEGFLYRYRKGEEVRIVCVCHGRFLSPAEFVKHAGGGDVSHPLRHIVVNTLRPSVT